MFEEDQSADMDFRLADFALEVGDAIRFREWDPKTKKYTGREFVKQVKKLVHTGSPNRYWGPKEIVNYGMYLIEWEE